MISISVGEFIEIENKNRIGYDRYMDKIDEIK